MGVSALRNGRTKPGLIITDTDDARLRALIERHRMAATESPWALLVLEQQLNKAQIVPSREVPEDEVTVRSRVRVRTEGDQDLAEYTIEYPHQAHLDQGSISILIPLASALGERSGGEMAWNLASGLRRYKIGRNSVSAGSSRSLRSVSHNDLMPKESIVIQAGAAEVTTGEAKVVRYSTA